MKILMLSPNQISRYNWGHQLFRDEFGRQTPTKYYGNGFLGFNSKLTVQQIIRNHCDWKPDLIMTYGWRYSKDFKGLGKINDIPKVHITVDYGRPEGIPIQNAFFKQNKYDLVFAITLNAWRLLRKNKVCDMIEISPFSVDTTKYVSLGLKKKDQVLAAFTTRSDIYPDRTKVQQIIKSMGYPVVTRRIVHQELIKSINRSKIIVTSNNIFRSVSMRYTETMSCGGFLLADEPEDMDFLGYIDGKHFVVYRDMRDLQRKIRYYMTHDRQREKIAKQGMEFVRETYSNEKRVQDMIKLMKQRLYS